MSIRRLPGFLLVVLVSCLAGAFPGSAADDGFVADLDAEIFAKIAVQSDGKILIGGVFTTVNGVSRPNLARLNPDGSVDTTFNPAPNGEVRVIAVQPDDKILVGGWFDSIAGAPRSRLARLNSDGSIDDDFLAECNDRVEVVHLFANGQMLVAGNFTSINATARTRIARLNEDGSVDTTFTASANSLIYTLAVLPDGKIVVGGIFGQAGGQSRTRLARFHSDGALDSEFDPGADGTVRTMALQADGSLLVGGVFDEMAGEARAHLARLLPDGSLDEDFDPGTNHTVFNIRVLRDGGILLAGQFNTVAGETRNRLARLLPDGSLDPVFLPQLNETAFEAVEQADGKVVVGGRFTTAKGEPRLYCARYYPDGSLDRTLVANANAPVRALAAQPDGQVHAGGDFTSIGGEMEKALARLSSGGKVDLTFSAAANGAVNALAMLPDGQLLVGGAFASIGGGGQRLARLNEDGSLDTAFLPELDDEVLALVAMPDGSVLAGGAFTTVNGAPRPHLVMLRPDGETETAFAMEANGPVRALLRLPDGGWVIGGDFTEVNGAPRQRLARLRADGDLVADFLASADGSVHALLPLAGGGFLVGGAFAHINGESCPALARLEASGARAASFAPAPDGAVLALVAQADGRVLCAGEFTEMHGQPRARLARLLPDGSLDPDFIDAANGTVRALLLQDDGKVLVGGDFTELNGLPRAGLGRLENGSAGRLLRQSANGLELILEATGSGPRLDAVWFELETPGQGWLPIGEGTRVDGKWRLRTGALPRGEICRVRALGRPAGSSAGSLHASVAHFYLPELEGAVLLVELLDDNEDDPQPVAALFAGDDSLDFGAIRPGTSAIRRLRLRNFGDEELTLNSAGLSDPRFVFDEPPVLGSLAPGESTDLTLRMNAAVAGPVSGSLSIASNDSGSPLVLALGGAGVLATETRLLSLEIDPGPFEPDFAPYRNHYAVAFPFEVAELDTTAEAVSAEAVIRLNGKIVPSGALSVPVPLRVGQQVLTWRVTAQDGVSVRDYRLTVTRAARFDPVIPLDARVARELGLDLTGDWQVLSVSNLPPGLRFDPDSGLVTGRPRRAGVFTLRVRLRDSDNRIRVDTLRFEIAPLPATALGSFVGFGGRQAFINSGLGGWLRCQVAARGAVSGRLYCGTKSHAFRGWAFNDDTDTVWVEAEIKRTGLPPLLVELVLNDDNRLTGTVSVGMETWGIDEGWRRVWQRRQPVSEPRTGSFNTLLELHPGWADEDGVPKGAGYARLTAGKAGDTRWSGRTALGQAFSFASFVGPQGETALWRLLSPRQSGSLRVSAQIGPAGMLAGAGQWVKQQDTRPGQRLYADGFGTGLEGPVTLEVRGARWQKPATGATVFGWSAAQISFSGAGVEASAGPSPSMQAPLLPAASLQLPKPGSLGNGAFLTVKIRPGTGVVSGGFKLFDLNPERPGALLPRPVRFEGLLLPGFNRGGGFFLLDQLAQPPLTTARSSPVLSGWWSITPPPP